MLQLQDMFQRVNNDLQMQQFELNTSAKKLEQKNEKIQKMEEKLQASKEKQ